MFRIPEVLAGILRFDGVVTNSIGLYVNGGLSLPSLPVEFYLYSGPCITADYLAKEKSISKSCGPLFLKGILNFWQA